MTFYFDQPRNLLIYDRPSPLVLQHTQGAREVNGQYVAVPRTLRNSQVLRWLNYPVMPVITDKNYDWPIEPNKAPLIHQKMMANFGVLHPRMFNLSDMGTMKTLATLWAADWLMKQHPDGTFRALIVAPLSIAASGRMRTSDFPVFAASSIPSEVSPMRVAGFRLATTAICRPTRAAGS